MVAAGWGVRVFFVCDDVLGRCTCCVWWCCGWVHTYCSVSVCRCMSTVVTPSLELAQYR